MIRMYMSIPRRRKVKRRARTRTAVLLSSSSSTKKTENINDKLISNKKTVFILFIFIMYICSVCLNVCIFMTPKNVCGHNSSF